MPNLRQILLPLFAFPAVCVLVVLLWLGFLPDPVLVIRMDFGNLLFSLGLVVLLGFAALKISMGSFRRRITAQIQVEAAAERRRFLGRLDHELKNPLTAVRAGLANLAEAPSEESRREAFSSVEAQTLRLSRLAADLRKLADLETCPLEHSPVDLVEMLQEVFDLAQTHPRANERRLTLTLPRAPWPLPTVKGDRDLLFLAMHNLLDNAIKFTRPGNTIEVRALEDGSTVVLEVADTGPGIPADDLSHVWEELYRGKEARGIPGSGLGLALVRAIVLRHGGQVNLRSRSGQGTVVTLRLPLN